MLKKIFIAALLKVTLSSKSQAQTQDSIFTVLNSIDLNYYLDKPIDSLLAAIPLYTTNQMKIYGYSTGYRARCLAILYPNKVVLKVQPKKYQFMNPIDTNKIWNLDLFKKETANYIQLFYEGMGMKTAGPL